MNSDFYESIIRRHEDNMRPIHPIVNRLRMSRISKFFYAIVWEDGEYWKRQQHEIIPLLRSHFIWNSVHVTDLVFGTMQSIGICEPLLLLFQFIRYNESLMKMIKKSGYNCGVETLMELFRATCPLLPLADQDKMKKLSTLMNFKQKEEEEEVNEESQDRVNKKRRTTLLLN